MERWKLVGFARNVSGYILNKIVLISFDDFVTIGILHFGFDNPNV